MPLICESCLGDNPYVRMTRWDHDDKECKICTLPFTACRWLPDGAVTTRNTEICQTCSCNLKNVCQVCLLDLKYGLPVQVRDKITITHDDSWQNLCMFYIIGFRHEIPETGELSHQNIKHHYFCFIPLSENDTQRMGAAISITEGGGSRTCENDGASSS